MPKDKIKDRLIVALDVDSLFQAEKIVNLLYPEVKIFKVGSQLFTAAGLEIIKLIHKHGAEVFLDLKYHDIPNTVKNAVSAAANLKVKMLTVHICGGQDMLKSAVSVANRPKIIGVTVLTSKSEENVKDKVLGLVKIAKESGLDGVVCSVGEASAVKKECGKDFIVVTPGIRPQGAAKDDQARVATAKDAIKAGSDFIVVGRPIIEAKDPKLAAQKILEEIKSGE
jgi:orotidine-5'-phosphate decarboxylase